MRSHSMTSAATDLLAQVPSAISSDLGVAVLEAAPIPEVTHGASVPIPLKAPPPKHNTSAVAAVVVAVLLAALVGSAVLLRVRTQRRSQRNLRDALYPSGKELEYNGKHTQLVEMKGGDLSAQI